MQKKIFIVCFLLLGIVGKLYAQRIEIKQPVHKNKRTVNVGQSFDIKLASNRTTGYGWDADYQKSRVKLESNEYKYVGAKSEKMIVGRGGISVFKFKALKHGKTKIVFKYYRPGQGEESAIKEKIYYINIIEKKEHTLDVNVGQSFDIKLASNRTTGYGWDADYQESRVKLESNEYKYVGAKSEKMIVGRGGISVFKFKALKHGKTKIVFKYTSRNFNNTQTLPRLHDSSTKNNKQDDFMSLTSNLNRPWQGKESAIKEKVYYINIVEKNNTIGKKEGTWR